MTEYSSYKQVQKLPRVPLKGSIDLTYRCNNNCRHCWLRIPPDSPEKARELTFEEIIALAGEAGKMGCRKWSISGGEPMLRPDFADIFDFLTRDRTYTLNTNGTLITSRIARLMKRRGSNLIALYGATAGVHDHITRNPGSFEALMRGIALLKEAGAGFTAQIVPMKDNFHEFRAMVDLAESLSPSWRIGASWLYLSACGTPEKNREIEAQRLPPSEVTEFDQPGPEAGGEMEDGGRAYACPESDGRLFAPCISSRRDFHVDPRGGISFCGFIQEPGLRYDWRKGSFEDAWERFIPSLAGRVRGGEEYAAGCGACERRADCHWCPVFGYLEHRRYGAKVEYLCRAAAESRRFKDRWLTNHRRYYAIGDMTVQLDSDLPFAENTFIENFERFRTGGPGPENIRLRHHFSLPDLDGVDLGVEVYRRPPYAVYRKGNSWIYKGIFPDPEDRRVHRLIVFNEDHTRARIYSPSGEAFTRGGLNSLAFFSSDQSYLARALAGREGCYLHAAGVIMDGKGLCFTGHSEAGKSTMIKMLHGRAETLCDDRVILRRRPEGFKIYGTWSHGEIPDVSPNSALLRAILFIEKYEGNRILQIADRSQKIKKIIELIIRPLLTADWWEKTLDLAEKIADEVPCYTLFFDKSGKVADLLRDL